MIRESDPFRGADSRGADSRRARTCRTAAATASTVTAVRQGGRASAEGGAGHSSKKRSRQGEQGNDADTAMCGPAAAPPGAVRAGDDGPWMVTVGIPAAAARWAGPLSFPT